MCCRDGGIFFLKIKQIDVSFLCVRPVIDHEFRNRKYTAKVGQDNVNIDVVTIVYTVYMYQLIWFAAKGR